MEARKKRSDFSIHRIKRLGLDEAKRIIGSLRFKNVGKWFI